MTYRPNILGFCLREDAHKKSVFLVVCQKGSGGFFVGTILKSLISDNLVKIILVMFFKKLLLSICNNLLNLVNHRLHNQKDSQVSMSLRQSIELTTQLLLIAQNTAKMILFMVCI